jgi:hypothetical protein
MHIVTIALWLAAVSSAFSLVAQSTPQELLLGRWEMAVYSEQGVQVNKLGDAAEQAAAVYQHIAEQRRDQFWIAYADTYEQGIRDSRSYRRWAERDSLMETSRIAEAIAMPYYVAFFADSTLAGYNRHFITGRVSQTEAFRYVLSKEGKSLAIKDNQGYVTRWHAQILYLDAERLVLFLPEEAEVVELRRAEYRFP